MTGTLRRVAAGVVALQLVASCGLSSGTADSEASPAPEQGSETEPDVAERYTAAEARTTLSVTGTADVALPRPRTATRPTGSEPALALGPLIETAPPAALADPPGPGRVLVATVEGQVLAVDLVARTTEVVMDLRDRTALGGEHGLLGLAIDPQGERLYLDYTAVDGDTEIRSWELDDEGLPVHDGCSVTGGYVYRGEQNPGLHGWYLFADFCGAWVRAVPADDP